MAWATQPPWGPRTTSNGDSEQAAIECFIGLSGERLGTVSLDADATIGQFKARVRKLLATRFSFGVVAYMFKKGKFEIGGECFSFYDDYTRFMLTATLRGKREIQATLLQPIGSL